jgi:tetratricopeptide (TPR) repeat protein
LLDVSPALFNRARPLLEQARHMLENPLMAMFGTVSWNDLAECALALGNTDDAREFIEQALNHPTALVKLFRPRTLLNKTELCLMTGDVESAQESVNAAHNMAHEKGMTWFFPMIEYALGRVSAARNHDERALRHFMRADELGVPMTFRPTVWRARDCAADALSRLGRERDAEHVRGAALAMAEEIAAQFDSPELRDTFFERVDRAHNRT